MHRFTWIRSIHLLVVVFFLQCTAGESFAAEPIQQIVLKRQLKLIDDTPAHKPVIMRLDIELETLAKQAGGKPKAMRAKWLAAGLSPQAGLYRRFGMSDLVGFSKLVLGEAKFPHVRLHRDAFAGRDLTAEIQAAYQKVAKAYGKPLKKLPGAPIYKVAFGYQKTTNAAMEGRDQRTRRHIVILNRSALAEGGDWDAAIVHETWHTFQGNIGKTLADRAIHEGVATHLTKVITPKLEDHKIMLWDKRKWQAAEARKAAIIKAFMRAKDTTDQKTINSFMVLGKSLPDVKGSPDRCGYYVGLLACRAWVKANPKATPADLIAAKPAAILRSLGGK